MYKLAIIGCGRIANKHIQAALKNKSIQIVSLCDVVASKCNELINNNCSCLSKTELPKIYCDYLVMLDNEQIDIVAICTESGYHSEIAINCMQHGKHVLVEKPMALSTTDADFMIETAAKYNVKLGICHQNRFNKPIQKVKEALDHGRFGKLIAGNARILWNRGLDYYLQAPWRGTYALDGGCLMNQCIHNIDLLQWLLGGEVNWINADVSNNMHPYIEAEDYGTIQIKFENGSIGNVEGTVCIYPKNLEETLTIIGEKGVAVIGGEAVNRLEIWRFADGLDAEEQAIAENNEKIDSVYGNGHSLLYKDFIEALECGREPLVDGKEGKKALEIILAAYKSSAEEQRVYSPFLNLKTIDFLDIKRTINKG